MRVLIDANVLVRILLPSANPVRSVDVIVEAAFNQAFTILVPLALRRELLDTVASKPYLSTRIDGHVARGLVARLELSGERLPSLIGPHRPTSRDPKDNYLIAYAEAGRAGFLVTDDADLLVLDGTFPFRILSPPDFLSVLREHGLI